VIIFVQLRFDLDVMPLMLFYGFRVLDAVPLFIFIIFQYIVVAIFPDISRHIRLPDAVRRLGLLIMLILALILSHGTSRANQCES
jgi:hypothetical protein